MERRQHIADRYRRVRAATEALCAPLAVDDYLLQACEDTSPPKWHLGHTSWFYETFVLAPLAPGWRPIDERYATLFNSYYESVGPQHPRPQRSLLSRPTLEEVARYRRLVDEAVLAALHQLGGDHLARALERVTLGLHHEQQHQELLLMDLRRSFHANPMRPAYRHDLATAHGDPPPLAWIDIPGSVHAIGARGGFCYDNELPRHRVLTESFQLASRLVTNAEWLEFLGDGGYDRTDLWLSDGWSWVQREQVVAPLYWERRDGAWQHFTLGGMRPLDPGAPVSHVSYYEADAFARWAGARLPTEAEWELAEERAGGRGSLLEDETFEPSPARGPGLSQMIGDLWELTASPYAAYPGYRPLAGSLGEYNGKFMCNQQVQRGGSCLTPAAHIRPSYRNFYYPHQRWNTQGLRLAR